MTYKPEKRSPESRAHSALTFIGDWFGTGKIDLNKKDHYDTLVAVIAREIEAAERRGPTR